MFVWNADVLVSPISMFMGYKFQSPQMKQVVRHVMHRKFSENLSSRSASAQQPLEPCVEVHEVEPKQPAFLPSSVMQSFSISHDEAYAVVDTGCQRPAEGRNTLTKLMRCMPSDLQVKFENQRFHFTGVGGETITTKVALIRVHPASSVQQSWGTRQKHLCYFPYQSCRP